MALTFKIEHFEGPLDLLLQLVEREELDISQISLAGVAEQFMHHVQGNQEIQLEEMADFLLVAAKLVYIKSRLLMPDLVDAEMDEGPDLESQLRAYRAFVQASHKIEAMWNSDMRSFARERRLVRITERKFSPPPEVTIEVMSETMQRVIRRLEPIFRLPKAALQRVVTVQEKIRQLYQHIRTKAKMVFSDFVSHKASKTEAVAGFLALLELVKQRYVRVNQATLFQDIEIESHPERPDVDPFVESFA
ncbi:MAG: ScpA family protein [Patescibacteria group bacterium]|nr:ScpA family protein [Patescibacteria group bacterium]